MPRGKSAVSKEIKDQILKRIRDDGVTVATAAQDHGLNPKLIYNWIAKGVTANPTLLELSKLKRENTALKELIGELTLEFSTLKKKADGS
jgi:transposase-like protein